MQDQNIVLNKPTVSGVITCFNDINFIERAISSLKNQSYALNELIVVDDGSDLATKGILRSLKNKIDVLITQENKGVCIARNVGFEAAKSDYILSLDSDDYFEPGFLRHAIESLDPSVGMVTSWVQIVDEKCRAIGAFKPSGAEADIAIYYNNATGSALIKKEAWRSVGGYDNNMDKGFEDWEFNIAICKAGWSIKVLKDYFFLYTRKEISRNSKGKNFQKEMRQYAFNKHQDLLIADFSKTIDFFLEEIELEKKRTLEFKNSRSYKLGYTLTLPFRFLKKNIHW